VPRMRLLSTRTSVISITVQGVGAGSSAEDRFKASAFAAAPARLSDGENVISTLDRHRAGRYRQARHYYECGQGAGRKQVHPEPASVPCRIPVHTFLPFFQLLLSVMSMPFIKKG
jgi:hypothetical protein